MRIALVLMALWASNAMALDFKGVVMGEPATPESLARLGDLLPRGVYRTELEDMVVFTTLTLGDGGRVEQISVEFLPYEFDSIALAATKKWGKPVRATIPMQNGFGAQYVNHELTWNREGWTVRMFEYVDAKSGSLDIGRTEAPKPITPDSRM